MKNLKGACIYGQSGGPTAVINASACGVFQEALKQELITKVYGASHGIKGILEENLYDINQEDPAQIELLKNTPAASMGSVRYKLNDYAFDDTDYYRLLGVFKKYDIRYFFYNGGNDSMDTCNKVSKFLQDVGYACNVIGVPKTIDNDLAATDHCPGYSSAAKYVATTITEVYHDMDVYDTGTVCIIEIMGRNAGWLTAASALAHVNGEHGPDLIYLPEVPFDMEKFVKDVRRAAANNKDKVLVCVSEGLHDKDGAYVSDYFATGGKQDSFGHAQLGGLADVLERVVKQEIGFKVRAIELSLMQRCASHIASGRDIEEAYNVGKTAVQAACKGLTDKMVVMERAKKSEYEIEYKLADVALGANTEKTLPIEWINKEQNGITKEFIDYALPLIQGDPKVLYVNGLPVHAKLKKILVKK